MKAWARHNKIQTYTCTPIQMHLLPQERDALLPSCSALKRLLLRPELGPFPPSKILKANEREKLIRYEYNKV